MIQRLSQNPLIQPSDVRPSRPDFEVIGAFNAGVARIGDEVILLLRVAERLKERDPDWVTAPIWNTRTGEVDLFRARRDDEALDLEDERVFRYRGNFYLSSLSHLRVARSSDGIQFSLEDQPALFPACNTESFGLEDPRITQMGKDYWITYKAVSEHGITTALAQTCDFREFTRHGVIFCPENLDVVIFPKTFDGKYVAWTRPVGRHIGLPTIWVARSPDLLHWGDHEPVLAPRPGMWDAARVGSSAVPFLTAQGWLEIYHGADVNHRYCVGLALIDAEDPTKILARSEVPVMQPEAPYELSGFFGNVVFPCGVDLRPDNTLTLYYGAADETTCGASTSVNELLASLSTS